VSALLYPTLPGVTYNSIRAPFWRTGVQTALSGKSSTISYMTYPLTKFTLLYDDSNGGFLRDTTWVASSEVKALVGLFQQMRGRFDTFLYTDPQFNSVTAQQFGVGDGVTTLFAITAAYQNPSGPGAPELIQNFNGTPTFYDNGTLISSSNYTLGPSLTPSVNAGFILFNTAPTSGHSLTWTGSWYYRCRFDEDTYEFTQFLQGLWSAKKVSFSSVLL
jgi:hypothetical protein